MKISVRNLSFTSRRLLQISRHHFRTSCMLMTSLLYPRSVICKFQSHSYFLPLKTVSLHGVHTHAMVVPRSSYYSPRSFGWSDQPKIQCCHNPKQNITPIFIEFRQLYGKGKNGKLNFGTTHVIEIRWKYN